MKRSNLRDFLAALKTDRALVEITHPVDPNLEIAEIHRRVAAADGPALLFTNVKGSAFPVATNLFGSVARVECAFPNRPERLVEDLIDLATRELPPKAAALWEKRKSLKALLQLGTRSVRKAPVTQQHTLDLHQLPMLKSWPADGGHFLTLPLVFTQCPDGGPSNLGMYRMQRYDAQTMGLHCQIQKGAGFHLYKAEARNQPLPVTVFLGGPPALILSAIAPLPENVPELVLASLLHGSKLPTTKEGLIAEAEFALVGETRPHERRPEGPFGDHYGYYSLQHDFPVFHCAKVHHRKGAIYPATVVGKPRQEDFYIGAYLQKLMKPLFPVVMPGVRDLWSYGETGFHSLTAAIIHERYEREGMSAAFRILGEGQLALSKFLLLTDQPVDLEDFPAVLTTVLARFRPETDLFVFANLSFDTLDYTGPSLNKGSRGVLIGTGPEIRNLPSHTPTGRARPFCPGCLVVEGEDIETLRQAFKEWPLIVLVDDVDKATRDTTAFLWTVFTRFEPAADIHATHKIHRHHLCYELPILIDARMKPTYPPELQCDPATEALVTENWNRYFPEGQEMGDSSTAHAV